MIYLGGSCSSEHRTVMRRVAQLLRENDFEVYCPFELKIENAWDYPQEEWAQMVFDEDKAHLDKCDLFLFISSGRVSTAGCNWEQGYAYAKGIPTIVFQYTDEPTSLMTFCSSTKFINTTEKNLLYDLNRYLVNDRMVPRTCRTILT